MRGLPYAELSARVIHPFLGETLSFETLLTLCRRAYAGFDHPATVPLIQLEDGLWVQELFHGPTLAFKDVAMQLLGRMIARTLASNSLFSAILFSLCLEGMNASEITAERKRERNLGSSPIG